MRPELRRLQNFAEFEVGEIGIDRPAQLRLFRQHPTAALWRLPFSRIIHPTPPPGGLGMHLTLNTIDYDVDPWQEACFSDAIRTHWPDLPDGALRPVYKSGRRSRSGGSTTDFLLLTEKDYGVRGLINLFGRARGHKADDG